MANPSCGVHKPGSYRGRIAVPSASNEMSAHEAFGYKPSDFLLLGHFFIAAVTVLSDVTLSM